MKNWKNWIIFTPIKDVYNSLFNNDAGISFRKLYAVLAMHYAFNLQKSVTDDNVKKWIILAWMVLGATCIGLVTIPQLIQFLQEKKEKEEAK